MNEVLQALEETGFTSTGVEVGDATEWRYRNRTRNTGIRVLTSDGDRFWGWIASLDAAGRVRPLDRDTVELYWDDLGSALGTPSQSREAELAEAIRARGTSLRARPTRSPL
jgi:hypothetical protein